MKEQQPVNHQRVNCAFYVFDSEGGRQGRIRILLNDEMNAPVFLPAIAGMLNA